MDERRKAPSFETVTLWLVGAMLLAGMILAGLVVWTTPMWA